MTTDRSAEMTRRLQSQAQPPEKTTLVKLTRKQKENVAHYLALSRRPRPKPLPMVTAQEFAAIPCTRCGNCCTMMTLGFDPKDRLARFAGDAGAHLHERNRKESMRQVTMIAEMLVKVDLGPVVEKVLGPGRAVYSCKNFKRDAEGLGICTVYDQRPDMCSRFPYGASQAIPDCSYWVHQVKRKLPMIPSPVQSLETAP